MARINNIRKPPNRGYRKKDRIRRRPFAEVMDDLEERNRRLWVQKQPRTENLYDEIDRHGPNPYKEKNPRGK